MTIAERYARAIRSSHLEWKVEASDIDMLMAAGLVRDGIGTDLIRLRCERDSIGNLPGSRLASKMLRSLPATRARLLKYASEQSGYTEQSLELQAVVKTVLDLFLDPQCPPCGGTGKIGAYGSAMPMCPTCRGSTKRQAFWGDQPELEKLADYITAQMDAKMDAALHRIRKLLRDS